MSGVLYISYESILKPLGQSQALSYFMRLAVDRPIHVVSFEKADNWIDAAERKKLLFPSQNASEIVGLTRE